MTSNWSDAMRAQLLADIQCPKCHNSNSPGKLLIQLEDDGTAVCGYCAHSWTPPKE